VSRHTSQSIIDRLRLLLLLDRTGLDGPVEHVVILEALSDEQVSEKLSEVRVIGLVVESKRSAVVEVDGEFVGEGSAEHFGGGGHLCDQSAFRYLDDTKSRTLLHDSVVLLLLGSCLQSLPRELTSEEVLPLAKWPYDIVPPTHHEDVAKRLEIISSRLLDTQVGVDRSVSSSTRQVLVLSVRDVQVGLGVSVLLGQSKVDHVDLVASLANAHEEVVRLDISVDEVSGVDVLDSRDQLVGEKENSLEAELSVAEVEQVFERGSAVMSAVSSKPRLDTYRRSRTMAL
jgi:hypothetical protein